MILPLGKRTRFFVLVWLAVFLALPGLCCRADECGFGGCPAMAPPCYKVTLSGVMDPWGRGDCVPYSSLNNTWMLKRMGSCTWQTQEGELVVLHIDEDSGVWVYRDETFCCEGPHPSGSCSNCFVCEILPYDCHWEFACSPGYHCSRNEAGGGCNGVAYYEPVWDCSQCGNCSSPGLGIVNSPDATVHFANESCCPPAARGDPITVTIKCTSGCEGETLYVKPGVSSYDPNLVNVEYDPDCREGSSVSFKLTGGAGPGHVSMSVTCTALFFCSNGLVASQSVLVDVLPQCGDCCDTGKKEDPTVCPPVAGST
ncbi:MAG: hypothetical protein ACYTEX_25530 [Planctomycetota bacterium]|jgi:hypothetical protein